MSDGRTLSWEELLQDFPTWDDHAKAAACEWAFIAPEVRCTNVLQRVMYCDHRNHAPRVILMRSLRGIEYRV